MNRQLCENRRTPQRSVLVVDDDPIALQVARERLQALGYTVKLRETAIGTMEIVFREGPDCVLLDVDMPALSGDGLAQLLRRGRRRTEVCVILHSSLPWEELDELVASSGAHGAIRKTADAVLFAREFTAIFTLHLAGLRR